jgi:hypothetical protein
VIPEIRLVVCAIAADNAANGWLGVTDVGLVATDRFECDAIISCARAGGVLSISMVSFHLISIYRSKTSCYLLVVCGHSRSSFRISDRMNLVSISPASHL